MSTFHRLLIRGGLLLLLISLTSAVPLDSACTDATQCTGTGARCHEGRCRCDTPWYKPCGTTDCSLNLRFAYEGQECRVDDNCLSNMACESQRCRCKPSFTAMNGLCYKSLNVTCGNSNECWSRDCRDTVCKCPVGYESRGDRNLCHLKLARAYANWTYANQSGDFCYSDLSNYGCADINAVCRSVAPNQERFCQCLSPYRVNQAAHECELIEYPGELSPAKTPLPNEECGSCKDDNALCVWAANQTTCWCQSGYGKTGENKCDSNKRRVLFPNSGDSGFYRSAVAGCTVAGGGNTVSATGGLCTCAPHYSYADKDSSCGHIEAKWEDDAFEYGVCTRIDSYGVSQAPSGLCNANLTCNARQDKHVCGCTRRDQYFSEIGARNCYHFLDRNLAEPDNNACPPGAIFNNSQCHCSPQSLYTTSNDKRRCELHLSDQDSETGCVAGETQFNQTCTTAFGEYTRFCRQGECRCIPGKSFSQGGRCVTFLDVATSNSNNCPENAENFAGLCKCRIGYRDNANGKRVCNRKVDQLYDQLNPPTQSNANDVNTTDCQVLFPTEPVKAHHNSCVCDDGTFLYNTTGCRYYLDYVFPNAGIPHNCPEFTIQTNGKCECKAGYRNQGDNRTCVRITDTVYPYNTTVASIAGISEEACRNLFGYAAQPSADNGHCECRNETLAFLSGNRCYFRVEINQDSITPLMDCPENTVAGSRVCHCRAGYEPTDSNRRCTRKNISPTTLYAVDPNAFSVGCAAPNNDTDCIELHGQGAICRNGTCYCDRERSFAHNQRCELFSKYVFPGAHERAAFTCNSHEDCGTDAGSSGIECDFISAYETRYKVCKCKAGYLLNPVDSTCVIGRCFPLCRENEECWHYTCVCKEGHYRDSAGNCVRREPPLQLHERCNTTVWGAGVVQNEELFCSAGCQRAECYQNSRNDGSRCVKSGFDDFCAHDSDICGRLGSYAFCSNETNRCACAPGFYRADGGQTCARAAGTACSSHVECGDFADCLGRRCRCKSGRREERVTDVLGRSITRCINGVSPMQFSPILVLAVVLARLIFA